MEVDRSEGRISCHPRRRCRGCKTRMRHSPQRSFNNRATSAQLPCTLLPSVWFACTPVIDKPPIGPNVDSQCVRDVSVKLGLHGASPPRWRSSGPVERRWSGRRRRAACYEAAVRAGDGARSARAREDICGRLEVSEWVTRQSNNVVAAALMHCVNPGTSAAMLGAPFTDLLCPIHFTRPHRHCW